MHVVNLNNKCIPQVDNLQKLIFWIPWCWGHKFLYFPWSECMPGALTNSSLTTSAEEILHPGFPRELNSEFQTIWKLFPMFQTYRTLRIHFSYISEVPISRNRNISCLELPSSIEYLREEKYVGNYKLWTFTLIFLS